MEERERNGRKYTFPVQSDHFILRDAPKLAAYFEQRGISKPRELDVILPFPVLEQNYDANYQVWASGVLLCQGDGRRVLYANPMRVSEDDKGVHVYNQAGPTLVANGVAQCAFTWGDEEIVLGEIVECPGSAQDGWPHCAACKMSAILKVTPYADELFEFGYYQISTGSWRNHQTIMGTLESLPPVVFEKKLPFTLRMVQEQTVYTDKEGKRKATDRWFLHLMPHPDLLKALFARQAHELATGEPVQRPQLPAQVDYEAEPPAPPPYAERQSITDEPAWGEPPPGGEYVDGEWEAQGPPPDADLQQEPAPPAQPQPEPKAEEPKAPPPSGRPYDPETLKRRVQTVAGNKRNRGGPTVAMIGLVLALSGQMWEEPKENMPRLLEYLFDKKSIDECTAKEVSSLIDWLKDPNSKAGHATIDQRAVSEAAQVIKLMRKREGQQALPGME